MTAAIEGIADFAANCMFMSSQHLVRRVLLRPRTPSDMTDSQSSVLMSFSEYQHDQRRPTKTNTYQRDQRQTNRIPKIIPVTPHALKLLDQPQPVIREVNQAHEGQRGAAAIMVTMALRAVKAAPAACRFAV